MRSAVLPVRCHWYCLKILRQWSLILLDPVRLSALPFASLPFGPIRVTTKLYAITFICGDIASLVVQGEFRPCSHDASVAPIRPTSTDVAQNFPLIFSLSFPSSGRWHRFGSA